MAASRLLAAGRSWRGRTDRPLTLPRAPGPPSGDRARQRGQLPFALGATASRDRGLGGRGAALLCPDGDILVHVGEAVGVDGRQLLGTAEALFEVIAPDAASGA